MLRPQMGRLKIHTDREESDFPLARRLYVSVVGKSMYRSLLSVVCGAWGIGVLQIPKYGYYLSFAEELEGWDIPEAPYIVSLRQLHWIWYSTR